MSGSLIFLNADENKLTLPQSEAEIIPFKYMIVQGIEGFWIPNSRLDEYQKSEDLYYMAEAEIKKQKEIIIVLATTSAIGITISLGVISGVIIYSVLKYYGK